MPSVNSFAVLGFVAEDGTAYAHPHKVLALHEIVNVDLGEAAVLVSYCPLFRGGDAFSAEPVAKAAEAHGRSPAQIILRWHVQQDGVVAIPRTRTPARIAENLAIFDFELSSDEMAAISALTSAGNRICDFAFSPDWD